jgi:hypothetical protein
MARAIGIDASRGVENRGKGAEKTQAQIGRARLAFAEDRARAQHEAAAATRSAAVNAEEQLVASHHQSVNAAELKKPRSR